MRIIAIGLGGAGCRIVDSLYAIDQRSSRIACVQGLAVDVDETTLQQLTTLPDSLKMYFPPFDPTNPDSSAERSPTATIDIAEIVSRIHNFETGENDAIFICCGLGGRMADIVPHVIAELRSSIVEPLFGLVTLPCLAEGEKCSSKAADDIDILSPLLDGMILFDNETWYKKTKAARARPVKKDKGFAQMLGFGKPEPEISPELAAYMHLNEILVRRISLILKAGEFRADGGIDLAEVVLDSGEVLNTMRDGGFITIGYAVEHLPSNPLAFLSQLKPAGLFNEENKKKASRIVELAKQAIYHEVSTPCDMTSAHKALVLIAGPSHELSMQGYMTVRKWIDRSIRGLETRSGDYPVMNTKNVAIIVMLSGLENIPRINELREIRKQVRLGTLFRSSSDDKSTITSRQQPDTASLRDEMIVLPTAMQKKTGRISYPEEDVPRSVRPPVREKAGTVHPVGRPAPHSRQPADHASETVSRYPPEEGTVADPGIPRHSRIVSPDQTTPETRQPVQQPLSSPYEPSTETSPAPKSITGIHSKEIARQRIEQELQRQRLMALSGNKARPGMPATPPASQKPPAEIIRPKRQVILSSSHSPPVAESAESHKDDLPQAATKKTVILRKRTPAPDVPETRPPAAHDTLPSQEDEPGTSELFPEDIPGPAQEGETIEVKDSSFRAKDGIFLGKGVRETAMPKARDASLIHTNLKPKKPAELADRDDIPEGLPDHDDELSPRQQHDKKVKKKDDLSWI